MRRTKGALERFVCNWKELKQPSEWGERKWGENTDVEHSSYSEYTRATDIQVLCVEQEARSQTGHLWKVPRIAALGWGASGDRSRSTRLSAHLSWGRDVSSCLLLEKR